MIDAEKLAAFALVSGITSVIPGPSMLFVMGQAMWRGPRTGTLALAGEQLGYIGWRVLAAFGLGTLAAAFPLAFRALALGGALYLGWLGMQALRHAGAVSESGGEPARKPSAHAFRDGVLVALSNPKALVYIVALLPPFVDTHRAVVPQLLHHSWVTSSVVTTRTPSWMYAVALHVSDRAGGRRAARER